MKIIFTEKETNAMENILKFHLKLKKSLFEVIKEKFVAGTIINERGNTTISLRPDFVIKIINILEQYTDIIGPISRRLFSENLFALDIKEAIDEEEKFLSSSITNEESVPEEETIDDVVKYMNEYLDSVKFQINKYHFLEYMKIKFIRFNFEYSIKDFRYILIITNIKSCAEYNYRLFVSTEGKFTAVLIDPIKDKEERVLEKIYNSDIYADFLSFDHSTDISVIIKFMNKYYEETTEFTHYETPSEKEYIYVKDKDLGEFRYQFTTDKIEVITK